MHLEGGSDPQGVPRKLYSSIARAAVVLTGHYARNVNGMGWQLGLDAKGVVSSKSKYFMTMENCIFWGVYKDCNCSIISEV